MGGYSSQRRANVAVATAVGLALVSSVLTACAPSAANQRPRISGTALVSEPLSATTGKWNSVVSKFEYRWQSCARSSSDCREVGTNASTYSPTLADHGRFVRVVVKARNNSGASSQTSEPVGPIAARVIGGLHINGDAPGTDSVEVLLDIFALVGPAPTEVRIANGTSVEGAPWRSYESSIPWTLAPSGGSGTVSAQMRQGGVESPVFSDEIRFVEGGPVITDVPIDFRFSQTDAASIEVVTGGAESAEIVVIEADGTQTTSPMLPVPAARSAKSSLVSSTARRFSWPIPPSLTDSFEFTVRASGGSSTFDAPINGRYRAFLISDPSSTRRTINLKHSTLTGTVLERTLSYAGVADPTNGAYSLASTVPIVGSIRILRSPSGDGHLFDTKRNLFVELGAGAVGPADSTDLESLLAEAPLNGIIVRSMQQLPAPPGLTSYRASGEVPGDGAVADQVRATLTFDRAGTLVSSEVESGEAGQTRESFTSVPTGATVGVTAPPAGIESLSIDEYAEILASSVVAPAGLRQAAKAGSGRAGLAGGCDLSPLVGIILGAVAVGYVGWQWAAIQGAVSWAFGAWGVGIGALSFWALRKAARQYFDDAVNSAGQCFDPLIKAFGGGDPHLKSFDGLGYDVHAEGEFVYTRSTTDGLEVQIRTVFATPRMALIDRVGVRTPQGQTVEFGDGSAWVDGSEITDSSTVPLTGGGTATQDGVSLPDGSSVEITSRRAPMNLTVALPFSRGGGIEGLAGTADDVWENDVGAPGREPIDPLILADIDGFDKLYNEVLPAWLVPSSRRLFSTPQRPYTPPLPGDPMSGVTDQQRAEARAVCEARGWTAENGLANCIFDVALTGDSAFADPAGQFDGWADAVLAGNAPTLDPPGAVDPWVVSDTGLGEEVGDVVEFDCPAGGSPHPVWGTNVYAGGSSICTAAVHAGLIGFVEGGSVSFEIRGPQSEFVASSHNGVSTRGYSSWPFSFSFPAATPHPVDANVIDWDRSADFYSDLPTTSFTRTCSPGGTERPIWGTATYTGDSSICTAAVHAGLITFASGGSVSFELTGEQPAFTSSTSNGVTSGEWGNWPSSFRFV